MSSVRFPALGTSAHLLVTPSTAIGRAERILRESLAEVDLACSRFRPDSALSAVNADGGGEWVDPVLFAALRVALTAAEQTDGLVTPTMGNALISIGYDRTFADIAPSGPAVAVTAMPVSTWHDIRLEPRTRSVRLPRGVRLDLGATAKAWAADRAAERIAEELGGGVLVNLGGDVAIAGERRPWKVRVADDHRATEGGQVVVVRSGGLATSSTTVRAWRRGEQVLHHVLDPSTGLPARRVWRTVTVSARTCVAANTAATAAVVLGSRAPGWLATRDVPARLAATDGTVTGVAGWPDDLLEAA